MPDGEEIVMMNGFWGESVRFVMWLGVIVSIEKLLDKYQKIGKIQKIFIKISNLFP